MLRLDRAGEALTLVSRLARPRVLAVLAALLAGLALAALRLGSGLAAAAVAGGAAALLVLGGRSVRATLARGRVSVSGAVPLRRLERPLSEFSRVAVETVGEARARRAARLARGYRARAGDDPPSWVAAPAAPGSNDHLRRLVLAAPAGEPLPLTAWLPPEDDLEPARNAVEGLLR
jgi:hypothetical protein